MSKSKADSTVASFFTTLVLAQLSSLHLVTLFFTSTPPHITHVGEYRPVQYYQSKQGSAPETVNLQKEVVDKCFDIIQQWGTDKVTKPRVTILLQQSIPHETPISRCSTALKPTGGEQAGELLRQESCLRETSQMNNE